jgi:hypothetical protein
MASSGSVDGIEVDPLFDIEEEAPHVMFDRDIPKYEGVPSHL